MLDDLRGEPSETATPQPRIASPEQLARALDGASEMRIVVGAVDAEAAPA